MSFGHVASAISSLKSNRALRPSKKNGFKSNNRDVSNSSGTKTELKFKEVSQEELEKVKARMKKRIQKSRNRTILISVILTVIILGVLYSYIN